MGLAVKQRSKSPLSCDLVYQKTDPGAMIYIISERRISSHPTRNPVSAGELSRPEKQDTRSGIDALHNALAPTKSALLATRLFGILIRLCMIHRSVPSSLLALASRSTSPFATSQDEAHRISWHSRNYSPVIPAFAGMTGE